MDLQRVVHGHLRQSCARLDPAWDQGSPERKVIEPVRAQRVIEGNLGGLTAAAPVDPDAAARTANRLRDILSTPMTLPPGPIHPVECTKRYIPSPFIGLNRNPA